MRLRRFDGNSSELLGCHAQGKLSAEPTTPQGDRRQLPCFSHIGKHVADKANQAAQGALLLVGDMGETGEFCDRCDVALILIGPEDAIDVLICLDIQRSPSVLLRPSSDVLDMGRPCRCGFGC